ncbi:kanadaptin [Tanacetum coccineum]|uniref:Kanadaptin n=1 Tax=Tanacetum coccineum TaxID=301880 RepID=A0ABQ4Z0U1_9ASTR
MTTDMGPPPPRNPATTTISDQPPSTETLVDDTFKSPMGPPPSINPTIEPPLPNENQPLLADVTTTEEAISVPESKIKDQKPSINVPYTIPEWSEAPCHNYFLEVLKDGSIIDQFDVYEKGAYMFGRVDHCDFVLEHPTISRFHAGNQSNFVFYVNH